jgi:hypothetical protein
MPLPLQRGVQHGLGVLLDPGVGHVFYGYDEQPWNAGSGDPAYNFRPSRALNS